MKGFMMWTGIVFWALFALCYLAIIWKVFLEWRDGRKREKKQRNLYYDAVTRSYINADGKEFDDDKNVEETDNGVGRSEEPGQAGEEEI